LITYDVLSGKQDMREALFHQMMRDGFRLNDMPFLAVLSTFAHGGLVDDTSRATTASQRRPSTIRRRLAP
jgi:hypothetical protein